ncbi:hypothetical protein AVEN_138848-1 [Araneus ventricosus]|uniref:Uncharacterized protein n=1 Tax=Araneus ventricosus TaxID=182803 RepID=A0A4Y2GBM7_ARAVE|nr:hypothetical protein AVEN_138848-1 [Araneus ventricosus]
MRIVDGIRSSFRCVRNMEIVTRKEIEDPAFINECVEKNSAFLKSLPNSLPPIFHTLVFQRNKRELRITSRNKRESRVTSKKKNIASDFEKQKSIASNFEKQRSIASNKENPRSSEKQKSLASKVVLRL